MTADQTPKLDATITIRRAETIADYRACQDAQRKAWGISDEGYLVPVATMVGANLHGGLVLGAFLPDGEAVAMSFAFLGRVERRLCLYSQLTGVIPAYQSRGLGYEIKLRQREIAHAEGIERIAWAFDPMQAGNAHFNLARLKATAGLFIENMYGLRTDALNAGVPTDRLIAEWDTQERAESGVSISTAAGVPRLIEAEQGGGEPLALDQSTLDAPYLLLEIPSNIAELRRQNPGLAERWRGLVSQSFTAAFAAGYRVVDVVRENRSSTRRSFYVLERV